MTKVGDITGAQLFCDWILANYPGRIGLYNHGLGETAGQPNLLIREKIVASAPWSGYQAGGGYLPGGWLYPNWGETEVAFQKAVEDGATSVEIYRSDLLQNDELFEALVKELSIGLKTNVGN